MNQPFWDKLKPGFHHRRVGTARTGFECFVWRGQPGPVLLLNAGTHGDEYEGPDCLHSWVKDWRPRNLTGTVVAIPVLNESAFLAGSRCSEVDGKNLARVFPGKASGTYTVKIAHLFRTRILRYADYYVDFHSAGAAYEILPWVGYTVVPDKKVMEDQRKMAQCFDRYWCWGAPGLPGRTLSAAADLGIPAIYTESRGGGTVRRTDTEALQRSTIRMLKAFGFIPGKVQLKRQKITRESHDSKEAHLDWQHPSPCAGLVIKHTPLGKRLCKGEEFCVVQPLHGGKPRSVKAMRTGKVVFVRRHRAIQKNESLGVLVPV